MTTIALADLETEIEAGWEERDTLSPRPRARSAPRSKRP